MTAAVLFSRTAVRPVTVRRRVRPRPVVDLNRLTRYRGGTYSHTVDTIVFIDGSSARTDLIRLNPGVAAYSLDFNAASPTRPSQYLAESWTALTNLHAHAHEVEIDWIMRNSYPRLGTAELSRRLRAAGHRLGAANLAEHEAIAATQAAIWNLTNGLDLDNRPLNVPARSIWKGNALTAEFGAERELASYTIDLTGPGSVSLYSSVDGKDWREVAASTLTAEHAGTYRKVLGVGATVSDIRYGQGSAGHAYYRFVVEGSARIEDARFVLAGSGNYRNHDRVVALYDHLLAGARQARARAAAPRLTAAHAAVVDGVIGPFRLAATDQARLDAGSAALVDADGATITEPVHPGSAFYLRPADGETSATVTMTVPGNPEGYGGRVIAGVARDEASANYTPLALAVPAELVVDFEIDWA